MRQWRNGAGNAPRHYAGTRSATGRALSRTRSLTAAAVAVAMMATVAVTSLIPAYNAKADENTLENGSKCTPTSYTLGDASDIAGEDTGVATYVGRDLYVGKNKDNKTSINNEGDVDGSYAVEAEGLTVVNGKLVMRPLKDSWKAPDSSGTYTGAGFRWGTVGFGSQFRPGNGKTVLAIGDTNSGIDTLTSGGVQGTVGAYGKGGFVGQSYAQWNGNKPTGPARGYKYKASIAGGETKWSSNEERSSIVATQGDWKNDANGDVTFNASDPLKSVNGTDYSAYGNYIQQKLSEPLSKIPDTSTDITISVAPEDPIDRYKYNYGDGNSVSYKFIYNNTTTIVDNNSVKNNEKLITFKGDGVSAMQVFNIKGTDLSSAHYRGVDFKFVDIPDDASVVINVDGSNIDFHTGWRFWWGDTEIGGGFSQKETDNVRKLYSSAAQKIMWNFKNATNVIIRGGVANEDMSGNKLTTDDPAAAMLGSILVPKGSFESHVSTNGRVYVGQDFMMYNPTAIKYESIDAGWEGKTASVLNMDQERHNLPWNGQMIANCPAIQWNKANSAGEALKGTTWKVYGTLEAAEAGTPSLGTITDGEFTDGNDKDGIIKFEGIERNAKYFVKEFATNSTEYTVNPYIYQINTGDDESTHTGIAHVFNAEGNEITGTNADKKLTVSDQIINEKEDAALEWSKVDGTDTNKILSGSEWQLQKQGSSEAYQITDSTKAVQTVEIQYNGGSTSSVDLVYNVAVDLTATVKDSQGATDGVPQAVKWSSSDAAVVSVNDGTVLGLKNGIATITACSVADSSKCTTINVRVTGAPADTKNTTTFYLNADGYTASSKTKLYYTFDGTTWTSAVMADTENCGGWISATIDNPGFKAVTYLFYKGDDTGSATDWYHNGASSQDFTLQAGQSAVHVQNHMAVNGAPSGCSAGGGSGSGGSTTTGTVAISGSTEVGLNKSIELKATTDPANDTITSWSSGDTSVATVVGSGKTVTVVGEKTGRSTITVVTSSNAMASVTITVKDDSTVNVYFKKSTVNWGDGNYYLHYQPKTGTSWPAVKMTDAGDCNDYVVASIPKVNVAANHGYYFRNSADPQNGGWYNSNGQNATGDPFTFWDGTYTDMYVNTNSDKQRGKPQSCKVTSSAAKVKAHVSAAMLKSNKTDVIAVNDAEGSGTSAAPIVHSRGDALGKCDMNTEPGKFRVVDLADGAYTLTETVAPNGYTAGGSYTVTIANGTATITDASGKAIAGNKIPNARNTGAILWNKVSSDSNNGKKLSGSEWKLTKTKNFGWNDNDKDKAEYTDIASADQKLITIADCVPAENKTAAETTCSAPAGAAEGQPYDVDPAAGQFKLEGLDWGTYTLVETKAPDGYDVDSTVRTFTFGPTADTDGTGTWKSNSVESKTGDTTGAFTTSDVEYDSSVFTFSVNGIKNKPGVILPGTGGVGDYWIYAAALVAALIGVVAAGMALKVRRRQ